MPAASIRPLHGGDDEIVRWVVHRAITWEDPLDGPAASSLLSDPLIVRYHAGWGRGGDFGVAAEVGGRVVGAAFARLFTPDAPGFGFVDRVTPELGIAVDRGHRRHGVGTRLLAELASAADMTSENRP